MHEKAELNANSDDLTKRTGSRSVDLTEEELTRVSGAAGTTQWIQGVPGED
jgi:hypothetical protein